MFAFGRLAAIWLGTTVAIDVEARVKFTTPSLTREVAFDVGRTVFAAQHKLESALALGTLAAFATAPAEPSSRAKLALAVASTALLTQLLVLSPRLMRRADAIIRRTPPPPETDVHRYYIVTELIKIGALLFVVH